MINRKGEISTIVILGTLVVMGVAALMSSTVNNQKNITDTKAAGACPITNVSLEGSVCKVQINFTPGDPEPASPRTLVCALINPLRSSTIPQDQQLATQGIVTYDVFNKTNIGSIQLNKVADFNNKLSPQPTDGNYKLVVYDFTNPDGCLKETSIPVNTVQTAFGGTGGNTPAPTTGAALNPTIAPTQATPNPTSGNTNPTPTQTISDRTRGNTTPTPTSTKVCSGNLVKCPSSNLCVPALVECPENNPTPTTAKICTGNLVKCPNSNLCVPALVECPENNPTPTTAKICTGNLVKCPNSNLCVPALVECPENNPTQAPVRLENGLPVPPLPSSSRKVKIMSDTVARVCIGEPRVDNGCVDIYGFYSN